MAGTNSGSAPPTRPQSTATAATSTETSQLSQPQTSTQQSSVRSTPAQSRDGSPVRPAFRQGPSAGGGTRSQNSGQQEHSPVRSEQPAATPLAKTLAAKSTPKLAPTPEQNTNDASPQKATTNTEHQKSPRWPISPRLRSPPPNLNRPSTLRKADSDTPSLNVQRATPLSTPQPPEMPQSDSDVDDTHLQPGYRTPGRGTSGNSSMLETVQESPMGSPQVLDEAMRRLGDSLVSTSSTEPDHSASLPPKTLKPKVNLPSAESSAEAAAAKDRRAPTTNAPPPLLKTRQSTTSIRSLAKTKPAETLTQGMTVETETVESIPQVAVAPNIGGSGTLRNRPSTETVRPRKEKKKTTRKVTAVPTGAGETAPQYSSSILRLPKLRHYSSLRSVSSATTSPTRLRGPSGFRNDEATSPVYPKSHSRAQSLILNSVSSLLTQNRAASSKADIFEAKIASAVEEADSSDSDETFVYDSNPPDSTERQRRFHSRTPSTTSMGSQVDRGGMRSINSVMDGSVPGLGMKKSMKFANNFTSSGNDSGLGDDEGKGTVRSGHRGTLRAHHHHIGRAGRNGTNNSSLFDSDGSLAINSAAAQRNRLGSGRHGSQPPSPRNANRVSGAGRRNMAMSSYDLDETTTAADDERTPLMGSGIRSPRSGRVRRQPGHVRSLEDQDYRPQPSLLTRFASCLVLTVMLLIVLSGAVGFMFATTQPLHDLELTAIRNVLASEQELMFDITVKAHNPNVVVVMIDQADMEVFAKSPHAGNDSEWWRRPRPGEDGEDSWMAQNDQSNGAIVYDVEEAPDDKAPNMRLGSIRTIDSPLSFEGSFFNHGVSASTGEVRLQLPGNGTQSGSERWERILQDEFDLIVKGVLKYNLPLSQRTKSVTISGKATVKPNSANDPRLLPNGTVTTD